LSPRVYGPFKIVQKINDNAYKVEFPGTYGVSTTFNVADLSLYLDDELDINPRANYVQPREDDTDQGLCSHHPTMLVSHSTTLLLTLRQTSHHV